VEENSEQPFENCEGVHHMAIWKQALQDDAVCIKKTYSASFAVMFKKWKKVNMTEI
jgi:hypothetical protein